tara:strand:- start:2118 stop:3677 length:1560 start_codon:yes stop_codon:yes gene_type:complete
MNKILQFPEEILGNLINLKKLSKTNISLNYHNWLNDKKVNQFLESRHSIHTKESAEKFVLECNDSEEIILFGIFTKVDNEHIGNIKLGDIDFNNLNANVGILIGNKDFWGRGIANEAIKLITYFAFTQLNLKGLCAGCYKENIGSKKAFLKAGWSIIGEYPKWRINNEGKLTNEILLSISNSDILIFNSKLEKITLFGSGPILIKTVKLFVSNNIETLIILAPRHANDEYVKLLNDLGCKTIIASNVNDNNHVLENIRKYNQLALCFGPAWIFNKEIISIFQSKIFNYNGIPLPDYLGGAHFSWQILNRNFEGGAYIQQITDAIDRGPIILSSKYKISPEINKPLFYEKINIENGIKLIEKFYQIINKNYLYISTNNSEIDWGKLTYFPRLNTEKQAWINWGWSGREIESFCNAFDNPYLGAKTQLDDQIFIFQEVDFLEDKNMHPFCAGLILRINKTNDEINIATHGGILRVKKVSSKDKKNVWNYLKLGKRFHTEENLLRDSFKEIKYNSRGLQNDI